MTLELIVFICAILFGIVWYWRESKSNKIYRTANKITHSKDLQMKADNRKGFIHQQPFLMRLVWITLLFVLFTSFVALATPINGFFIQYFASAIVGTLIGTYFASMVIFAKDSTSKENIEKAIDKGKDYVEDFVEDAEELIAGKVVETKAETKVEEAVKPEPEVKKSARDRLKDKGMIK